LHRDAGEFDGHCRVNLEMWNQWLPWLCHEFYDKSSPFLVWRICAIFSVENQRF